MKINNQKKATNTSTFFLFAIIITSALLLVAYLGNVAVLLQGVAGLWIVLVALILMFRFGGYHFMEIEISGHEADIKYYRLFPFGRQYKRIKIKGQQLQTVKIHKGFAGIAANLQIDVSTSKGKARYPFIGLAAVSPSDRKKMEEVLKKIKTPNIK